MERESKCPMCGGPIENDRCQYCGYDEKKAMQVSVDGDHISHQPESMANRQTAVNTAPNDMGVIPGVSRKSKTVALLLCIFLGGLGAHRFYVGKVGMGLIYLCSVGLFGVGWIIDIVLIITGSFRDEFDLPLR